MIEASEFFITSPTLFGNHQLGPLSFNARAGDVIAVCGESGVGKTSFLLSLMGALHFYRRDANVNGQLKIFGKEVPLNQPIEDVSFVSDNPYAQLTGLNNLLLEELVFPCELKANFNKDASNSGHFFSALFDLHRKIDYPLEWLSGGELMRMHLASSLINIPKIVLWDEPFDELDESGRLKAIEALAFYCRHWSAIGFVSLRDMDVWKKCSFSSQIFLSNSSKPANCEGIELTKSSKQESTKKVLEVNNLLFTRRESGMQFFDGLTFSISQSEILFLLGSNGSGKSTLAKLLSKELLMQSGIIKLNGKELGKLAIENLDEFLNIAFQDPNACLFCRTVGKEIESACRENQIAQGKVSELLDLLELSDSLGRHPYDLNRSDRRRLSVLTSLLRLTPLIILDEPTLQQDNRLISKIAHALQWGLDQGIGILCITHDQRLLKCFAKARRVVLKSAQMLYNKSSSISRNLNRDAKPDIQNNLLNDARRWAIHEWKEKTNDWFAQTIEVDKHWTRFVVPALREILSDVKWPSSISHLDVGCGAGLNTQKINSLLQDLSHRDVHTLGVDVQPALVEQAKRLKRDNRFVEFSCLDATSHDQVIELASNCFRTSPNVVTCFYVLHDEANMKAILRSIRSVMNVGGILVLGLIHPERAEVLLKEGRLKVVGDEDVSRSVHENHYARWAGYYPIRVRGENLTELPYFHRTVDDYLQALTSEEFELIHSLTLTKPEDEATRKSGLLVLAKKKA